ncbi:MAG: phosphatase PAP2 family protein [Verrucomicrobiae bacterium]|nr:phosphatase PAP2 family protein [Verrucomicrobiae bacterium]
MIAVFQRGDEALFRFVNRSCANPFGDTFFPIFNHAAPFLPLALALAAWLAWRHSPRAWKWALALVLGIALGDSLIFNPLKHFVARPRPAAARSDVRALASGATGGWSFPSSHTANAFLAAAMLAAAAPRWRRAGYLLAGLVGFSRVYVGVHYPSDVVVSALLGWSVGKGMIFAGRIAAGRWRRSRTPSEKSFPGSEEARAVRAVPPGLARHAARLLILLFVVIQGARLFWAATTDLDVPEASARLWSEAQQGEAPLPVRAWFLGFGDSPLSLWAIPWAFQTLWLALLLRLAGRFGGRRAMAAMLLLSVTIPWVSLLSFSGSSSFAFAESDWSASEPDRALIFYAGLGLPVWIAALTGFRRHPFLSGSALAGLLLGASFPQWPWGVVALFSSGAMLHLAVRLGRHLDRLGEPGSKRARVVLTLLLGYGLFVSACVYQPRLLRKLDLSFLPRNSPQYGQTGWTEYVRRIRPLREARPNAVVWTDSRASAWRLRYAFREPGGRTIRSHPQLASAGPKPGDLWLREVYLAQIHPRVLFVPRNEAVMRRFAGRLRELDSVEIFRKGDPIRQFQLWEFTERAENTR